MAFKVFRVGTYGDMERLKQEKENESFKRGLLDIDKYFKCMNPLEGTEVRKYQGKGEE